jgi:hypothetical protein
MHLEIEAAFWPTAERRLEMDIPPELIPIAGMLMVLGIIAIVFWYKGREKELQVHQDMRIREMEHQRKMKELELEVEKEKNRRAAEKTA